MLTISELMRVLQFGDSVLPVGSFTFSNGLESAVEHGVVHDLASLRQFVRIAIDQAATSDGIAVLAAFRAACAGDNARIDQADHAVFNRKLNEEIRTMTVRMGRKLAEMADRVVGPTIASAWLCRITAHETPGCYPIGQALVFASLGLSEQDAFAVHQYGLASMMLAASLRLMKLHYLDAQAVLFEINSEAGVAYQRIATSSLEDMATFAPVIDILASSHVQAKVRMFMN
ncbi:urease accessory protein UreF [Nitrospira sp. MA-1]|nr:urease accessory protein UreF [Nitrospira sp. MA-1]